MARYATGMDVKPMNTVIRPPKPWTGQPKPMNTRAMRRAAARSSKPGTKPEQEHTHADRS